VDRREGGPNWWEVGYRVGAALRSHHLPLDVGQLHGSPGRGDEAVPRQWQGSVQVRRLDTLLRPPSVHRPEYRRATAGSLQAADVVGVVRILRRLLTNNRADGDGHDGVLAVLMRPKPPRPEHSGHAGNVNWLSGMPITASTPQAGAWSCRRAIKRAVGTIPEPADKSLTRRRENMTSIEIPHVAESAECGLGEVWRSVMMLL